MTTAESYLGVWQNGAQGRSRTASQAGTGGDVGRVNVDPGTAKNDDALLRNLAHHAPRAPGDEMQAVLLRGVRRLMERMDCADLCILMWAFASIGSWATNATDVLESLVRQCEKMVSNFNNSQISLLTWADALMPIEHLTTMTGRLAVDVNGMRRGRGSGGPVVRNVTHNISHKGDRGDEIK